MEEIPILRPIVAWVEQEKGFSQAARQSLKAEKGNGKAVNMDNGEDVCCFPWFNDFGPLCLFLHTNFSSVML